MDELRKAIKSDVKIKLKKDGKGAYSWEIQGKDPQEVLKANETLKKKLGTSIHTLFSTLSDVQTPPLRRIPSCWVFARFPRTARPEAGVVLRHHVHEGILRNLITNEREYLSRIFG